MNLFRWQSRSTSTAKAPVAVAPATTSAYAGPQALTLQDLVLLRVALSWQEAVAVLLECMTSLSDRRAFPDPGRVTLSDIGEVRPLGAAGLPGHPVQAAAGFLRELLGSTLTPSELRTLVDENLATPPRHATIDEFAAALAYFERPGRRGDVAAVFGRGHALYVRAQSDLEFERLRARAAREQVATVAAAAVAGPTWRQHVLQGVLIVVLLAVIAVGGTALFTMAFAPLPGRAATGQAPVAASTTASITAAGQEATRLVNDGVARVSEALGRGGAASTPSEALAAGEPAANAGKGAAIGQRRSSAPPDVRPPNVRAGASGSGNAASAAPGTAPVKVDVAGTADARATTGVTSGGRSAVSRLATDADVPVRGWTVSVRDVTAAMASEALAEVPVSDVDESLPVFTSGDRDVVPALLVRPQLPTQQVDLGDTSQLSTLDLMIDEFGRVQRVHLDSVRNNINEKMLLSAAKAWIFQPAMRDGRPVRYRMRVRLAE